MESEYKFINDHLITTTGKIGREDDDDDDDEDGDGNKYERVPFPCIVLQIRWLIGLSHYSSSTLVLSSFSSPSSGSPLLLLCLGLDNLPGRIIPRV